MSPRQNVRDAPGREARRDGEVRTVAGRVDAAAGSIAARSPAIEAARAIPLDLVEDMREWGVFRLLVPAPLGGVEASPLDALDVIERLSRADGAVGWCAMIGTGNNLLASRLPERGARSVFASGLEITGGAFMPSGRARVQDGDYVLTGEWAFGSGIGHCDWVCGGAVVTAEDDEPVQQPGGAAEVRLLFVPRTDVEVLDTWDVAGLQGTGSHDYRIDGALVPSERTMVLFAHEPWTPGPLSRVPTFTLLFPLMGSVSLGIGRRAIDELTALAIDKVPYRTTKTLREREVAQATVARAEALVGSARAYLHDSVSRVWEAATSGGEIRIEDRALVRLATVNAGQAAAEAATLCYHAGGGTALYRRHPLQRCFRDAHAATQHYVLAHGGYETAGKVIFGLPPDGPI